MASTNARSAKWRRFVANRRAFVSLVLLALLFVASLVGNFFLPPPGEIVQPATVEAYRRVRVKVTPDLRAGRLDLRPDLSVASQTGCEPFSAALREGASLADALALPPDFAEAVAARFANSPAPAFSAVAGGVAFSMLEYAPRAAPPKTVRVRLRDDGATTHKPVTLVFMPSADAQKPAPPPARPAHASRAAYSALASQLDEPSRTALDALVSSAAPDAKGIPAAAAPARATLRFASGASAAAEAAPEPVAWPCRPVPGHPLGIDAAGRDVLSRIVAGTRTALVFGLALVLSSMLLGIAAGAVQGYFGGLVDIFGQRFIEIWSSLPFLYVMILVGSVFGRSFILLLLCYGLFNWIGISYYMRAEFLRLRSRPFVEAARCQGLSPARIIWRHILPNAMTPLVTLMPFSLIGAISSISALDFLGFGLPPLTPSLGELLRQAQQNTSAWWLVLYPSLVLFATMLLAVFVGEGLRDAFDPKPTARYK